MEPNYLKNIVKTEYVEWSARSFIVPFRERKPYAAETPPSWLSSDR